MPSAAVKFVKVQVLEGAVQCTPDPVRIRQADTLIVYTLATAGYAFPDEGAVVVAPGEGALTSEEFPYPAWQEDAQHVALFDRNAVAGNHSYTVTVVSASGEPLRHDPGIVNEGR